MSESDKLKEDIFNVIEKTLNQKEQTAKANQSQT